VAGYVTSGTSLLKPLEAAARSVIEVGAGDSDR
jgi:hypothetical protein